MPQCLETEFGHAAKEAKRSTASTGKIGRQSSTRPRSQSDLRRTLGARTAPFLFDNISSGKIASSGYQSPLPATALMTLHCAPALRFNSPKRMVTLKANILPMQPLCGCLIQLPPNGNDSCFAVGRTTVAPAISIDPS